MAAREKQVNRTLSYGASLCAVGITVGIWWIGTSRNDRYESFIGRMAVNPHAQGYGSRIACAACHVPQGGRRAMKTELNCLTSGCHGELEGPVPETHDEIYEKFKHYARQPDPFAAVREHLELHKAVKGQACWSCHSEHTRRPAVWPESLKRSAESMPRAERSLLGLTPESGEDGRVGEPHDVAG